MDAELFARNTAAHWVQAGVLATSALIALRLLALNEPRARLAAMHLTLAAIVFLPLMQRWQTVEPTVEVTTSGIVSTAASAGAQAMAAGSIGVASWPEPQIAVVLIISAGVGMRLLWLLYGIIRLGRFSRAAPPVPTPTAAIDVENGLGVSARYIQQTGGRGPWTFGWMRPTIALPARFDALAPAFQRAVICHELVHIKRRDIAIAFVEELAVAALWFHPWVWLLRAQIRVAREQAVDARVVSLLGNRDEYVRCLIDISGHDLAPHFSQAGAGMLRPRELRARVDAIFQEVHMSRARFAVAALTFLTVTIATALAVSAAMPLYARQYVASGFMTAEVLAKAAGRTPDAQAAAASNSPRRLINKVYPEYPQDALERGIKGTVIVDITVNAAGDVTTAAVESGPQELRASAFKAALALQYTPGSSTTSMKIAFNYSVTGTSWGVQISDPLQVIATKFFTAKITRESQGVPADRDATGAYRIGGAISPPKKIKDAPPQYPEEAQQARVQGVVILEARIDEAGNVSDARPLRSIPLLDQAAIDAVRQWQYTPTLLNGVAVPVIMTVTVNFALRTSTRGGIPVRMLFPDGRPLLEGYLQVDILERIAAPGMTPFHFKASRTPDSADITVSFFADEGQTHLGDVSLPADGSIVQSPTTPSFGVQLMTDRR
jgi:TonB family protein